ncbi:MAG: glycoside hydrolase family 38 C-terminal domain-containing protein [Myxococcota bacterium]|nr:glycoside hydrolase family 38 C-terminal domain-containing protein [Myxococcota bacterium]
MEQARSAPSEPRIKPLTTREKEIRTQLGIPLDAVRVMVFGESSHWDPNWLFTTEQYYQWRIRHILDKAIACLQEEPRRVFSIESLFFLQQYWERRPEQRDALVALINAGRLRLTGSGITTPDVTLPDTEAILRDYLLGQEWLRARGITVEPDLSYLPDDFGYSPALPSMLCALGIGMAGITRIDGMYFVGTDLRSKRSYPLPGSSAETLLREHKTQDFVWRGPDGAEVLCHWNAFTYFQGDLLAHVGIIRWMGIVFGLPWRTKRHVARRIEGFVRQLAPQSPTPYMFCPIGCDFNAPIAGLVGLLDRYNQERYPSTGIFAINAGMDDYLRLVDQHRHRLPTLAFDPNPYWMGFYASRPQAKRICKRVARKLVLAERLNTCVACPNRPESSGAFKWERDVAEDIAKSWDLLVLSNHHDFITGTSPDRVWRKEQLPWLKEAESLSDNALGKIGAHVADTEGPKPAVLPEWHFQDGRLTVSNRFYTAIFSEEVGGCMVSFSRRDDGINLLTGPGNDLVAYRESGGLWRMGHEYVGGHFREKARTSASRAAIEVHEQDGVLVAEVCAKLLGKEVTRVLWFRGDSPIIRMRIQGMAKRKTTITCCFPTQFKGDELTMDVPGGIVIRPTQKLYDPTFWPARTFVHFRDSSDRGGLAAFLGGPATASLKGGTLEWVALRNAPREMAYKILPVASHPASGTTDEATSFTYAIWFTKRGDFRDNALPEVAETALHRTWAHPLEKDLDAIAKSKLTSSHPQVLITAYKQAHRGEGMIARISSYAPQGTVVTLSCCQGVIQKAFLCDALERDIKALTVEGGAAVVPIKGNITTVRLVYQTAVAD